MGSVQYNVIGLMYTRKCPLACAHCITESSPEVNERMQFEKALDYIRVIPDFGSKLCFTGGEPLLYYRDITKLIREAKSLRLQIALVTGAGWVRNEVQTRSRIEGLVSAGLETLCISWDQYHEAFSTPNRAVLLARIAIESGLKVSVRTITPANGTKAKYQEKFAHLPIKLHEHPAIKLGRASSLPASDFEFVDEPPGGACNVIYSPVVEPDGNVYACCGPSHFCKKPSPFFLGNTNDKSLKDILAQGLKDPLLEIIYNVGPLGLYNLLKDHPLGRERFRPRSAYTHFCELCLDITDDPAFVNAIRERLSDVDGQRMAAVSRLWRQNSLNEQ
jgi:hypothetical protein